MGRMEPFKAVGRAVDWKGKETRKPKRKEEAQKRGGKVGNREYGRSQQMKCIFLICEDTVLRWSLHLQINSFKDRL